MKILLICNQHKHRDIVTAFLWNSFSDILLVRNQKLYLNFNKATWILLNVVILRNLLELSVHWVVCLIHVLYSEISKDNFPGAKKGATNLASACKPFSRRLHAGGRSHDAHAVGFRCVILKIPIMRGAIHRTFAWMIYILVSKRVSIEL